VANKNNFGISGGAGRGGFVTISGCAGNLVPSTTRTYPIGSPISITHNDAASFEIPLPEKTYKAKQLENIIQKYKKIKEVNAKMDVSISKEENKNMLESIKYTFNRWCEKTQKYIPFHEDE